MKKRTSKSRQSAYNSQSVAICVSDGANIRSEPIIHRRVLLAMLTCSAALSGSARADEGGLSFWLPGIYGSFAAHTKLKNSRPMKSLR